MSAGEDEPVDQAGFHVHQELGQCFVPYAIDHGDGRSRVVAVICMACGEVVGTDEPDARLGWGTDAA